MSAKRNNILTRENHCPNLRGQAKTGTARWAPHRYSERAALKPLGLLLILLFITTIAIHLARAQMGIIVRDNPRIVATRIPGLFNTGVSDSGVPLQDNNNDPHYKFTLPGFACLGCPWPAVVATSAGGFPIPPWLPDNSTSAWISPSASTSSHGDANNPGANYIYETHFDLTGLDPLKATITGRWATDNRGVGILINGLNTAQVNDAQFSAWTPFVITNGFVPGINTLTFLVNNGYMAIPADGPTGLRVEMDGRAFVLTPVNASMDLNADGLDDVWQRVYNASSLNPDADDDHDGASNRAEALAGTNPFDAHSCLRIISLKPPAPGISNALAVTFTSEIAKRYAVEATTDLRQPHWSQVGTAILASAQQSSIIVPRQAEISRFFRINVSDIDSDGDGLSNWAENHLAGFNPAQSSSAQPGLSDAMALWEQLAGGVPSLCHDRIYAKTNLPPNDPTYTTPLPRINSDGTIDATAVNQQALTGVTDKMWPPGTTISVGFISVPSTIIKDHVIKYAKEWETYANIKFEFVDDVSLAQVKIGFVKGDGSWSWLGRDITYNPLQKQTMNYGWFTDNTSETEFSRVILHEFGHVLGFVHEHQSPASGIPWNKPKVYEYFRIADGWSTAEVDEQVFRKYSYDETNYSQYDRYSIMHYAFPAELTVDGSFSPWNTTLSAIDKQYARIWYPFPPTPANASGLLHTGDDCDEIEFHVDFGAVPNQFISFILEPGIDPCNHLVDWWKKITIPVVGGGAHTLEMWGGNSANELLDFQFLDTNRPMGFGKAGFLGAHKDLNFTWNLFPAVRGGCRVTLIWKRDKCLCH